MKDPIIISVGGGKGGVGKSTITANIGTTLCQKGFSVGFIDADLGGANLHLCLGLRRPKRGLQDFIKGTFKNLNDVAIPTIVAKSWLISGASDILELANPNFAQKQKIINNLRKMEADFILVDLGAGSSYHVTDFFAAFPNGIIVTDGLPTSIENAYGYLKNGILRGMVRLFTGNPTLQSIIRNFTDPESKNGFITVNDLLNFLKNNYPNEVTVLTEWLHNRRSFLILNMVKSADDIKIGTRFAEMVKKYLSINLYYIGYILNAPEIRTSIKEMRPFMLNEEPSKTRECFEAVTQNLISISGELT
ncbi:MAG TPA: P-loop NTPase [Chitinispirillaceae bacterium]|nr:P-loop NTPase [Chitinispirillaceae bacterium]